MPFELWQQPPVINDDIVTATITQIKRTQVRKLTIGDFLKLKKILTDNLQDHTGV